MFPMSCEPLSEADANNELLRLEALKTALLKQHHMSDYTNEADAHNELVRLEALKTERLKQQGIYKVREAEQNKNILKRQAKYGLLPSWICLDDQW